jgi:hypothetical protein
LRYDRPAEWAAHYRQRAAECIGLADGSIDPRTAKLEMLTAWSGRDPREYASLAAPFRERMAMRRRAFIAALGGAAAGPLVGHAQQPAMPVDGFLRHSASAGSADLLVALRHCRDDTGFVEGKNLTIEYRWSETVFGRLPALAAELVSCPCSVSNGAALALKAATTTIPCPCRT